MSSKFIGFVLQEKPKIYVASIPGRWLLERTTPIWRIRDPQKGFQRMVSEKRAREIALAVLDQGRTFPNSIVLATDVPEFQVDKDSIKVETETKFLVVDGQHRLWAQKFSNFDAIYACLIHTGLSEVDMAKLFLEINDNQKRVPSSLRWDLVRLVMPEEDPYSIAAAEIVYLLATEEKSSLYQRIDLTGEQSEIQLKQGSLAPEIRSFLTKIKILDDMAFEIRYDLFERFFKAIETADGDEWGSKQSVFYGARVLRALIRLLVDIVKLDTFDFDNFSYQSFMPYLQKIDINTLDQGVIVAKQGSAGIKAIYDEIYSQVFG
ncbi:MAG: DGQHR domain-containing protein [Anaerolineales bacterium]|nr:DGQHR domain-containing protein [Anaerolineales bacterium]